MTFKFASNSMIANSLPIFDRVMKRGSRKRTRPVAIVATGADNVLRAVMLYFVRAEAR